MKKLIILFIFILSTYTHEVKAFDENQKFNIAGIQISAKMCSHADKISAFTTQLTNVNWQVLGAGTPAGITMGVVTNPSVILEFCNFLNQMQHLAVSDLIFGAMELGNKMMGNKFDDELNFLRNTYDLTATTVDMSGRGRNKSKLFSASYASRLNRWMGAGSKLHDKYRPESAIDLKTRQQKEADMSRLVSLAKRRAVLNDISDCPKGNTGDAKLDGLYEKDIVPMEENISLYTENVAHYVRSLQDMAIPSLPSDKMEAFLLDLSQIETMGVSYDIEVATRMVDTVRVKEIKKNSESKPTDPITKEVTEKLEQKYQLFKVKEDIELSNVFIKKYNSYWEIYSSLEATKSTRNLLNSPVKNNVEKHFKDYSILCNRTQLGKDNNLDFQDPNYYEELTIVYEKCKSEKDIEISQAGGLFKFYIQELQRFNKLLKEAQAYVWTFESYYLGHFRSVEGKQMDGLNQEVATCSRVANLGLINEIMSKQGSLNLEINQELVAETMKQNALLEQERAEKEKALQEAERRRKIEDEIQRRLSHEFSKEITIPSNRKGL